MNLIALEPFDLGIAALLVLLLALFSRGMRLGMERQILVAALRTTVQLLLIGYVLKVLFDSVDLVLMTVIALIMLLIAGREVMARQRQRFTGFWGMGIGTVSMLVSSFSVTLLALTVIIRIEPWYTPQYSIPLLGMMLGNTMNGIALGVDHLTTAARQQAEVIESRLCLGETWMHAISDIRRNSVRIALIPMINAMAAAGVVSLPGMMTGQILAGAPPLEAVKYQILIMFLITVSTGLGAVAAVMLASRRLFDSRHRLCLDRLRS